MVEETGEQCPEETTGTWSAQKKKKKNNNNNNFPFIIPHWGNS
jgi:hypothetical protein